MLVNYVELKYQKIWSNDLLKEKKWELKEQNFYFRAVKQGSVLVYLTGHIFLIFCIMMMATVRRSYFAFVYILIIIPRMKNGAEVLSQRELNQDQKKKDLEL